MRPPTMPRLGTVISIIAFFLLETDAFSVTPSFATSKARSAIVSFSAPRIPEIVSIRPLALRSPSTRSGVSCLRAMAQYTMEKTAELEGGAAKYKFSVQVPADLTKSSYATIMKDFKKNARFPGFRVGTVPAFMIPKVKSFVIMECLERTLKEAVDTENLELADSEKKPTLDDAQVERLTKNFKETEGFDYTIEGEFKSKAAVAAS